jgi:hypothetical protein
MRGTASWCALGVWAVLSACGREGSRAEPSSQTLRGKAESFIRSRRPFEGSLTCRSDVAGKVLLTFRESLSDTIQSVDVDPRPMVLLDSAGRSPLLLRRRAFRDSQATDLAAPQSVDSAGAVRLAQGVVGKAATLHCVIATQRAFFVEFVDTPQELSGRTRGITILVPRGGSVRRIGLFETP